MTRLPDAMNRRPLLLSVLVAVGLPLAGAEAKSVRAMLTLKGKKPQPGYVIKATPKNIEFSTNSSATSGNTYATELIEALSITVPDQWAVAEKLFNAGEYAKARTIYTQLRKDYFDLIPLRGEFAGLAAFREAECYRQLERWSDMRERGNALRPEYFEPSYQGKIRMYPLWYTFSEVQKDAGRILRLKTLVEPFRNQKESIDVMAQAAFLSGYVYEQEGEVEEALHDYHRAFTLNFGRDRGLAVKAMERALQLYAAEDPEELKENRERLREAHGLGQIYKGLKTGKIDKAIVHFTEPIPYEEEVPEDEAAGEDGEGPAKPAVAGMTAYNFRDFGVSYPTGWESDLRAPLGDVGFAGEDMAVYVERDASADDAEDWMEKAIRAVDSKHGTANLGELEERTVNGIESARVSFDAQLPGPGGAKAPRSVTLGAYVTRKGVYGIWVVGPRPLEEAEEKVRESILGSAAFPFTK